MKRQHAFTLVEVALALGIFAFAFVVIFALLPLSVKSNALSAESTRASFLLTALEADLRNIGGTANGSPLFGIPVFPYRQNGTDPNRIEINTPILTGAANATTLFLDESERVVGVGGTAPAAARYRVTILYPSVPQNSDPGSLRPVEARLIVSWPPQPNPLDPTQRQSLVGNVDTLLGFPVP